MSNVKKLRKKMNQQRFRKRRGAFQPFSEQTVNDETHIDAGLRKFWSQKIAPHSMGVSRASIPEDLQGTFEYRNHAKGLGVASIRYDRHNRPVQEINWLDVLFGPDADMTSAERSAVNRRIQELKIPADPTACVVIAKTKNTRLLLYYTNHKDSWWYIHTHVLSDRRMVVKQSTTFSSKSQAEATRLSLQLRWHQPNVIPPS